MSEIEEWAARERQRREAWLSGPTEAEKALWAQRERERRLAEQGRPWPRWPSRDPRRAMQRYMREMQLATEGAVSLFLKVSLTEVFDDLVRAGREWEDEFTAQPPRRRRIPIGDDADARESGRAPTRVPAPPEGSGQTD